MKKKSLLTGATVIAVASALVLSGCSSPDAQTPGGATTLTLASIMEPPSWDPADAVEGNQIQYAQPVYDSLLLRNPDGSIGPWLATEWSWDDSLLVLTLTLRDDVDFIDGEHFDAEAAKANLLHFQSANGPHANLLASVTDVTVVDEYTIAITNNAPNPALEESLGTMAGMMASPAKLEDPSLKTTPVGSGPYRLDSAATIAGDTYSFVRNDAYWNTEALPFDKLVIKYIPDNTARFNALVSGQINGGSGGGMNKQAEDAGLNIVSKANDWSGLTLWDRDGAVTPALADVRVRQAINYAIDRTTAAKLLSTFGTATPTASIFSPSGPAADKKAEDAYAYDPAKAKQLLADAGYADGFTLAMPASPGDPTQPEEINAFVTDQLGKVGITVEWTSVPFTEVFAKMLGGEYSAAFMYFNMPSPWMTITQYVTPDSTWNIFKTADPELDALIGQAQASTGEEQIKLYQEINRKVVDLGLYNPWVTLETSYYTSTDVTVEPQAAQIVPSIYNYHPAKP